MVKKLTRGKKTILIVEDNESMQEILRSKLASYPDYEIYSAWCAKKAFSLLEKNTVDIILLDLHLPDFHGLEVLKKIKKEQKTHAIEVIIITTKNNANDIEQCIQEGAFWYLSKTYDSLNLVHCLIQQALIYQETLSQLTDKQSSIASQSQST